ncbi:glycerol-3-phosphate 1-O-acyltransferase PlsY [Rhodobacteraceae bacterium 2CG4]|uniref:Glycerol-3-phosphate acyltransferase n=1 Tax=Halovulum marinum TaxID=2662447 RepID=A0A6L5Z429_9RHOB|nr:glycerol-3-phosphate 1-O-acyltransferase PlsY [Halovulum marinum]MSU91308.1 glycerol-3-phosphate 1-O-acyltransferase PlsY [Halovulum marinum]
MSWLLAALGGYLLGAVPFGLVITRALGLGDLRRIGSGNIGATNVLRTGHKGAALATLVLDSGKGAAAVLLALWLAPAAASVAGVGAFLGHLFPVWLGFRGGKGVATYLGILLALAPLAGLATCATWLLTALIFRISSLAALVAATLAPVWMLILGSPREAAAALVMAALIWWTHRANLARLRAGTEPRIGNAGKRS